MNEQAHNTAAEYLRDRLALGDHLVHAFAEWLGVYDLGSDPVGASAGLWNPRLVAVTGLRVSRGRASSRGFAEGLNWLRRRDFFQPHVLPVLEADPLAILSIALGIASLGDDADRRWIQDIARQATKGEVDPWRTALLCAAAGNPLTDPTLAAVLSPEVDQAVWIEAYSTAILFDDPSPERAAIRLAVLTQQPHLLAPFSKSEQLAPPILKILYLTANPITRDRLLLDEEARTIEKKIQASTHRDQLQVVTRSAVRPEDLQLALLKVRPTIVHFSGHGGGASGIILQGEEAGTEQHVSAKALHHLFDTFPGNVRVVVLSACTSIDQARAVAKAIDFVIGMKRSIDDDASRQFAASFYQSLAEGVPIGTAFSLGVNALKLYALSCDDVPKLFVRYGQSEDEVIIGALGRPNGLKGPRPSGSA